MRVIKLLLIGICLAIWGCNNSTKLSQSELRQTYVKTNKYIDVDMAKFSPQNSVATDQKITPEDSAQMFVALYRFYSHVKLGNGQYHCSLNQAKEINVSDSVFSFLQSGLTQLNRQIEQSRLQGKKVILPEVTPEYLQSLLE